MPRNVTPFILLVLGCLLVVRPSTASDAAPTPSPEAQIAAAVLAAPEGSRDDAGVLGYRNGALVTLRESGNGLVCLADNPADDRFQVACYPESLDPFMARGRALRAEGVASGKERNETRWKEIEAGTLAMPRAPTTLHILDGEGFDAEAGTVRAPYQRWVIYVPYATGASTGLGTQPTDAAPWLMVEGTPSAHIMITPPRPTEEN